jgi:hypothetical protein
VSTSDRRARDRDRDAAIKVVEAAWADGQIVEADRDKRVEELQRAQTLDEIDMFTRGLKSVAAPVAPELEPEPVIETPPPPVPYGPPPTSMADLSVAAGAGQRVAKIPKALWIVPVVVALFIGLAVVGGVLTLIDSASDSVGDVFDDAAIDSPTYAPGEEAEPGDVNVLSVQGYDDLVAAVEAKTGATTAFSAVLYPTYAVVELPVDSTTQRESYFYWDGRTLTDQDSKSTSSDERFNLATVDGAVVVRLVKKVRRMATEPTSWYAIVRAPRDDKTMIWAYASNEYNESVYVGARRDGTIIYNSTKQ